MKRAVLFILVGILFSSCTHKIIRTGYAVSKSDYKTCDVVIKKDISVDDGLAKKVGEIKLKDTGVPIACSEADAINILTKEACALNADLVVITNEQRANLAS